MRNVILVTVVILFQWISLTSAPYSETYVLKESDGLYLGQMKDGRKEGVGIKLFNSPEYYIGIWKNDKREGLGLFCRKITDKTDLHFGMYPQRLYLWRDDRIVKEISRQENPTIGNYHFESLDTGFILGTGDDCKNIYLQMNPNYSGYAADENWLDGLRIGTYVNGQRIGVSVSVNFPEKKVFIYRIANGAVIEKKELSIVDYYK